MYSTLPTLVAAVALAAPKVDVSTLDGLEVSGEFRGLSGDELVVSIDGEERTFPVANLLEVDFGDGEGPTTLDRSKLRVVLVDGTRVDAHSAVVAGASARLRTVRCGDFDVPIRALRSIRFGDADEKFDAPWSELAARRSTSDLLVVRKPEVLDHLKGVLGDVDDTSVRFVIGGNEVPVKLSKLYGVVYGNRTATGRDPVCVAVLHGAERAALASLRTEEGRLVGRLVAGGEVTIGLDELVRLDFSIGKVAYLSRLEPENVVYTPYLRIGDRAPTEDDLVWIRLRNDRNQDGDPIRIGKRTFSRGLWLHSGTAVRYRLASEYRTFKAVLGLESIATSRNYGNDVRVLVEGDDEVLFDEHVTSSDDPRELELDVRDVNFLEITVDFGRDRTDTLDHLGLGDARVLK